MIFAAFQMGHSVCLLNVRYPQAIQIAYARQAGAEWCFFPRTAPIRCAECPVEDKEPGFLFFSSGTTQSPKVIVHTLDSLLANARGVNEHLCLHERDRYLLSLPLHHTAGMGIVLRTLLAEAALVLSPSDLKDGIETLGVNVLSLVPTQLHRLLISSSGSLKKIKKILLGGSSIPDNLLARARAACCCPDISYGMTEMGSTIALSKTPIFQSPLADRAIKIDESGEIWVCGETLFQGYWQDNKLYLPLKDGWFATKDIAERSKNGGWKILGRKDTMLICGGENIFPEEIETILLKHASVIDAYVVGIPDIEWGEVPFAFIDGAEDLAAETLKAFLQEHLPALKIPRYFARFRTQENQGIKPSRKILQQRAAALLEEGSSGMWPDRHIHAQ